jgi:hypothetical protein
MYISPYKDRNWGRLTPVPFLRARSWSSYTFAVFIKEQVLNWSESDQRFCVSTLRIRSNSIASVQENASTTVKRCCTAQDSTTLRKLFSLVTDVMCWRKTFGLDSDQLHQYRQPCLLFAVKGAGLVSFPRRAGTERCTPPKLTSCEISFQVCFIVRILLLCSHQNLSFICFPSTLTSVPCLFFCSPSLWSTTWQGASMLQAFLEIHALFLQDCNHW